MSAVHALSMPAPGSPPFALRERVRSISDASPSPDPHVIAEAVLDSLADDEIRPALEQSLVAFVTEFVVSTRPTRRSTRRRKRKTPLAPVPAPAVGEGDEEEEEATSAPSVSLSWHERHEVSEFMKSKEFSPARGTWIFLEDANAEDIESMINRRIQLAEAHASKARWFRAVLDSLTAHAAATFGDLPEPEVLRLMDDPYSDPDAAPPAE